LSDAWESAPEPEVPLSPPITGEANVAMPTDESSLRTDVLYELWAAGRHGNAFSEHFDASELAALQPGEVLSPEPDIESPFVTPEEFERYADHFCS
jgi:hypothetical protein